MKLRPFSGTTPARLRHRPGTSPARERESCDSGFSLIETCLALAVLLIVALGLLPLGIVATTTSENQGHLMARTTEYAQDKMEQLMALTYGDSISDTRVFPTADVGGSGLTVGGSANPNAAVNLYVDWLDINGTLIPAGAGGGDPPGWFYKRAWQVTQAAPNLKQITVTTTVSSSVGGIGQIPRATVTSLKTFPF